MFKLKKIHCCCGSKHEQTHVHEFLGSVRIAEIEEDPHNHRFAALIGEVIPIPGGNHIHLIKTKTDFYENHFHEICVKSGPAVKVDDRHVHFVTGSTSVNDGHFHEFIFATLIENPIGD